MDLVSDCVLLRGVSPMRAERGTMSGTERRATWYVPMYDSSGEAPPPPEPPPHGAETGERAPAQVSEQQPKQLESREPREPRWAASPLSPLQRFASFRSEARVAVVRRGRSLEDLARRVQRRLRARSLVRDLTSEPVLSAAELSDRGRYRPLPDSVFGDPAELPTRLPLATAGVHVEGPQPAASPVPAPRASHRGKASIASQSSCESSELCEPPEADSVRSADSGVYSESEGCGSPPRPPPRPSKRRKKKRERYEVCLGYRCYELEADHCSITVYSLQKNKTALRELLQPPATAMTASTDRVLTSALDERRSSGGSSPGPRRTSSPRITPREVVSPCSSCHGTPASRRPRARSPSPQPSPQRRRQLPRSPSPPVSGSGGRQLGDPALETPRGPPEHHRGWEQREQRRTSAPANCSMPTAYQSSPATHQSSPATHQSSPATHQSSPATHQNAPKPRDNPPSADTSGHKQEPPQQQAPQREPEKGQAPVPELDDRALEQERARGREDAPCQERDGPAQERCPSPRRSLTPSPEETVPRPRLPHALLAAQPLVQEPTEELVEVGRTLRTLLLVRCPQLVRDRKYRLHTFRRCMVGTEMVDWLLQLSATVRSRQQAASIWQVMLEQGLVSHVTREHPFRDKYLFYRFRDDVDVMGSMNPTSSERREAESQLPTALATLQRRAPEALIRLILRKPSNQRTAEDLEMVYEELVHIRALSHLTNSVKRELAGVIVFESHLKAGTVLFHQGDEGQSWYIILRGSVNVVIHGKGTVTTLNDGDDFGNLALINDAPRAATIVCREDSCFFLRVDKEDFNRILRDVKANTVRLKEHGKDVLVLEKLAEPGMTAQFKYSVMAGTPQKMLEHLLETRFSGFSETRAAEITISDLFLDDFLLTHVIFFPFKDLTEELINKYRACQESNPDGEYVLACKRRVIRFLHQWASTIREPVLEDLSGINSSFLEDLYHLVEADATTYGSQFRDETHLMMDLMEMREKARQERQAYGVRKWKMPASGHRVTLFSGNSIDEEVADRVRPMQHHDEMIFRVYCADHTFCTLKFPLSATAAAVRRSAADKLGLSNDDLLLVQLKSSGERLPLKDSETSVTTGLSLNGRLFVSPKDHLDALTPLPEQEGPTESSSFDVEAYNTRELAVVMTQLDWEAFNKIHEYEILYHVTGREQQGRTTANLDVFLCRFTEHQHWVITEISLCGNLNRRVALMKKFIKLATACRELKNLNAFFAIVMGLSNSAVSRLTQTWEKLPSKFRKMYSSFEVLIDPTRNHRAYRVYMADLLPPIIPFMPLLIKDMTFTHDGNPTQINGLVNFEKMHMLAQTMRTLRYCRSRPLASPDSDQLSRIESEIRRQLRTLHVIDNQKILNALSQKQESRRA